MKQRFLIKLILGALIAFMAFWSYPILNAYGEMVDVPGEVLTALVIIPSLIATWVLTTSDES